MRLRRRRWLVLACGVVLAAILPYAGSLSAGYVFDDHLLVIENPRLTPATTLGELFRAESAREIYRPLTMATYLGVMRLGGGAAGQHAVNLALHAAASLAAFMLARTVLRSTGAGFLVALVFAVHPVHTEAVANLAGRGELLAGLLVFLTLACAERARRSGSTGWHAASIASFAAGILAKESAVTALPLLVLLAWWHRPRPRAADLARLLAPYAIVAALFVVVRTQVLGGVLMATPWPFLDNPLRYAGGWPRLATALVVLSDYVGLLAAPITLSPDYTFDQVPVVASPGDPRLLAAGLALAALVALALAFRRRLPVLGLGLAFAGLALALTANVLFPIGTIKAERLLYLPSFGWCLVCGWLAARWLREMSDVRRVTAVALVIAALGIRAAVYCEQWHDDASVFAAAVRSSPHSARAHANLAAIHGRAGRLGDAIAGYRRALEIYPRYALAARGLAHALELVGRRDEARRWFAEAERLSADRVATR